MNSMVETSVETVLYGWCVIKEKHAATQEYRGFDLVCAELALT